MQAKWVWEGRVLRYLHIVPGVSDPLMCSSGPLVLREKKDSESHTFFKHLEEAIVLEVDTRYELTGSPEFKGEHREVSSEAVSKICVNKSHSNPDRRKQP